MEHITEQQIKEIVMPRAEARSNRIIDTMSEEEIQRITQEVSRDPKKLETFMRTAYAFGFVCHVIEDEMSQDMMECFVKAMKGASYVASSIQLAHDLKQRN